MCRCLPMLSTQHTHLIIKSQGFLLLFMQHLLSFPQVLWIQGAMPAGMLQVCIYHPVMLAAGLCLQTVGACSHSGGHSASSHLFRLVELYRARCMDNSANQISW